MYECAYTSKNGTLIKKSFNSIIPTRNDYQEMTQLIKQGRCRELYVKKYFFDGVTCNIHFYKDIKTIAGLSCFGNKQSALIKLKALARKEYGYIQ